MSTRVLVPSGVLGLGFSSDALARGVQMQPDIICIDGGSTDSGPFSLGTGTSKYARAACKKEWQELMLARETLQVPLVISSCGTCGTDSMVEWMYDITAEIAEQLQLSVNVTLLFSEVSSNTVINKLEKRQCHALEPDIGLSESGLRDCAHIVALAGCEQIQAALQTGADIILAGRATDTAAICALPIQRGDHVGAAWHGAKIAECGAFCSTNPTSGVILLDVDETGFTVQAMANNASCTPHSVSAHMLYENANPFQLHEPGGLLDVTQAQYQQSENEAVRVTGSLWHTAPSYTVKLEGARPAGFQATLVAVIRNAHYVQHAQQWIERLEHVLDEQICSSLDVNKKQYALEFRLMGIDSVLGGLEHRSSLPVEVGVLVIVTASTQELTDEISKIVNPYLLHYPLTDNEPVPTFAFPYSPAHSNRGECYEFCINHVIALSEPMEVFRLETRTVNAHATR